MNSHILVIISTKSQLILKVKHKDIENNKWKNTKIYPNNKHKMPQAN